MKENRVAKPPSFLYSGQCWDMDFHYWSMITSQNSCYFPSIYFHSRCHEPFLIFFASRAICKKISRSEKPILKREFYSLICFPFVHFSPSNGANQSSEMCRTAFAPIPVTGHLDLMANPDGRCINRLKMSNLLIDSVRNPSSMDDFFAELLLQLVLFASSDQVLE